MSKSETRIEVTRADMTPYVLWKTNNFRCVHTRYHVHDPKRPRFVFEERSGTNALGEDIWVGTSHPNDVGALFEISLAIYNNSVGAK